jgi:hypothetical protein
MQPKGQAHTRADFCENESRLLPRFYQTAGTALPYLPEMIFRFAGCGNL